MKDVLLLNNGIMTVETRGEEEEEEDEEKRNGNGLSSIRIERNSF